jgi:hypothetical protein
MAALLVYGSLMHPAERAAHGARDRPVVPVRVRGFRRSFEQEPSWRGDGGDGRGVLTVRRSAGHWLNAVLIPGFTDGELASLDQRERGYTRTPVPPSAIEAYPSGARDSTARAGSPTRGATDPAGLEHEEIVVYVGRDGLRNQELRPNPAYLELCVEAARRLGPEFLDDFLATTFVGSTTLADRPAGS